MAEIKYLDDFFTRESFAEELKDSFASGFHVLAQVGVFTRERCGFFVRGNGYTNHCLQCLWSKHVDVNPGDRQATCQGLMEPVSVEIKGGEYIILHRCVSCNLKRGNKAAKDDNFDAILQLSAVQLNGRNTRKECGCNGCEVQLRKIAVLGDMLELGSYAERTHREAGERASKIANIIFTFGRNAKFIAESAKNKGFDPGRLFSYLNQEELIKELIRQIQAGDLILVKGSQGMRMEKIVKAIMANPEKAKDLLVRQDWKDN